MKVTTAPRWMKIYISGPISGNPTAREDFYNAEETLVTRGFLVVNPTNLGHDPFSTWTQCMRKDIGALVECDALFSLPGWIESRGARLERMVAGELAMPIFSCLMEVELWISRQKGAA